MAYQIIFIIGAVVYALIMLLILTAYMLNARILNAITRTVDRDRWLFPTR